MKRTTEALRLLAILPLVALCSCRGPLTRDAHAPSHDQVSVMTPAASREGQAPAEGGEAASESGEGESSES